MNLLIDATLKAFLPSLTVVWPDHIPDNHYCRFQSGDSINCVFYPILSHTPKGLWVTGYNNKPTFIRNAWRKKFAHATVEKAFIAFKLRKKKQIQILESQLIAAKENLDVAKAFNPPTKEPL